MVVAALGKQVQLPARQVVGLVVQVVRAIRLDHMAAMEIMLETVGLEVAAHLEAAAARGAQEMAVHSAGARHSGMVEAAAVAAQPMGPRRVQPEMVRQARPAL